MASRPIPSQPKIPSTKTMKSWWGRFKKPTRQEKSRKGGEEQTDVNDRRRKARPEADQGKVPAKSKGKDNKEDTTKKGEDKTKKGEEKTAGKGEEKDEEKTAESDSSGSSEDEESDSESQEGSKTDSEESGEEEQEGKGNNDGKGVTNGILKRKKKNESESEGNDEKEQDEEEEDEDEQKDESSEDDVESEEETSEAESETAKKRKLSSDESDEESESKEEPETKDKPGRKKARSSKVKKDEATEKKSKAKKGKKKAKKSKEGKKVKSGEDEEEEEEKKLEAAEAPIKRPKNESQKNSTKNRSDWQAFSRYLDNPKRCPAKIAAACKTKEGRSKLFQDFCETGRDTAEVEARFEARLEETQRTQLRYGFRNDVWLTKHHGERKAQKIMARKRQMGLNLYSTQPQPSCVKQPFPCNNPWAFTTSSSSSHHHRQSSRRECTSLWTTNKSPTI